MQPQLWHAIDVVASNGSATTGQNRTAAIVVVVLFVWLAYLTVGLLRAALRMLAGARLALAAAVLLGVPLTAIVVAASRLLT
ncbi:hypothetical protein DMB66_01530 [Actinoplanes sp. ATCC 53533]|uniref:hypothetical protein n=1 Tax=Actinoplanes sp. ATCC 53533 TaxID=1288362 RepID=UPI000F772C87|nr:hypothetical protein [Actinoplanes sp. ATCC 53533]RSM74135.1 hypothetical protein DMB66_01530 [Actinoplanes sp. ATCC 53533]